MYCWFMYQFLKICILDFISFIYFINHVAIIQLLSFKSIFITNAENN